MKKVLLTFFCVIAFFQILPLSAGNKAQNSRYIETPMTPEEVETISKEFFALTDEDIVPLAKLLNEWLEELRKQFAGQEKAGQARQGFGYQRPSFGRPYSPRPVSGFGRRFAPATRRFSPARRSVGGFGGFGGRRFMPSRR